LHITGCRSWIAGRWDRILIHGREEYGALLAPDGDVGMEGTGVGGLGMTSALDSSSAFLLLVVEVAEALVAHSG